MPTAVADPLEDLRARREALLSEMQTLSAAAFTTESRSRFEQADAEITEVEADIAIRERQAERESRAAAARAANGNTGTGAEGGNRGERRSGSRWSVGGEPTVYGRHSGHSYFLDLARISAGQGDGDGGLPAAEARLARHKTELRTDMEGRAERRAAAATAAYEKAMESGSIAERRAQERILARMEREGISPFEKRALNRTDGTGGYLVPPLWLIDELVPYLRAGRDFADLWRGMPLPAGTDSINIPRLKVGTGTGPQTADGGTVSGRDMSDDFVNAQVRTIAGQQDVALQLLDQSPIAFDELVFEDLAADYNSQLSGQCYVGSGTQGQINGVWPGGVISTSNGIYIANTNNAAGQTWTNGTGATPSVTGSVFQASGQMLSLVARTRLRPPTHHVWHPWLWYFLMTQVDTAGRPLVVPGTPNNIGYNQAAIEDDGPVVSGPVGWYQGLPVILDPNVPVTWPASGGTNPQITTLSAGQFAPTAGSGVFTPMLTGLWNDMFLWEGEMRTRALTEVLSGNLQVRFQLYNYVGAIPNRFQAYTDVSTGSGPTVVVKAGSSVSYATLTQYSATAGNSQLNMMGQGF